MRLRGATQTEIGRQTGLSPSRISQLLKAHRKDLLNRTDQNVKQWIADQIGRYEAVARQAARLLLRSTEDRQRIEKGPDGKVEKTIIEGQSGNAAYLGKIIEAFDRIDKLIGTEAPERKEVDATFRKDNQMTDEEEAASMDASMLPPAIMYQAFNIQAHDNSQAVNNGNGDNHEEHPDA